MDILEQARQYLKSKKSNQIDTPEIRSVKGLIRRCEAKQPAATWV